MVDDIPVDERWRDVHCVCACLSEGLCGGAVGDAVERVVRGGAIAHDGVFWADDGGCCLRRDGGLRG